MKDIPDSIVDKASKHVQRHARYYADSPNKRYAVRYPEHSATVFFSDDTWDLVEQLARHLHKQTATATGASRAKGERRR